MQAECTLPYYIDIKEVGSDWIGQGVCKHLRFSLHSIMQVAYKTQTHMLRVNIISTNKDLQLGFMMKSEDNSQILQLIHTQTGNRQMNRYTCSHKNLNKSLLSAVVICV